MFFLPGSCSLLSAYEHIIRRSVPVSTPRCNNPSHTRLEHTRDVSLDLVRDAFNSSYVTVGLPLSYFLLFLTFSVGLVPCGFPAIVVDDL